MKFAIPFRVPSFDQLKPRERLLAAGSGLVLLIVIMDRLVLSPWLRQGQMVAQETVRMGRALQHYSQLLARKDRVFAQLDAYRQYLRPTLVDELQTASLLKELEGLAGESHITLSEIKPLTVEQNPLMKRYPMDVQFECTIEEWVDFVIRVESSPSLFQIVRATMAVQSEHADRLKGSLRVVGAAMRPKAPGAQASLGVKDAQTAIR